MWLLAGLLGGLGGGGLVLLLQLIPYNAEKWGNKEFRRSLTSDEIIQLGNGQVVTKTQTYFQNGKRSKVTGPLRVELVGKDEYRFTPYGHWQQIESEGYISCEWDHTGIANEATTKYFNPNGTLWAFRYVVPVVLNNDSAREHRMIYFKASNPLDTIAVQHQYKKDGKFLKKEFWSFDAPGLRPVPRGWKFRQE